MKPIYLILITFLFSFSLFAQSSWRQVNTNSQEQIGSVIFQDSLVGYATAGNKILASTDAGENWSLFYEDTTLLAYSSITVVNDSIFIIGVDTGINSQTRTFSIQLINTFSKQLREFSLNFFPKPGSLLLSRNNSVLILSNSGDLLEYRNGNFNIVLSNCKHFSYNNNILLGVANYKIFISSNLSQNWDTISIPLYSYPISNSYFNGGDTIVLSFPTFPTHYSISYNRGLMWNDQTIVALANTQFLNSKRFFGLHSYFTPAVVKTTTNGGINYLSDTLSLSKKLFGVYQYSRQLAFVYGENGLLFKTTNLGGLVGINENQSFKETDFTIFPNPSQDYLQIKLADKERFSVKQINILSSKGTILDTFQTYQERIDLGKYAKGMYVIQIQTTEGSASKSFVVR